MGGGGGVMIPTDGDWRDNANISKMRTQYIRKKPQG